MSRNFAVYSVLHLAQRMREVLLRIPGHHVAVCVLIAANLLTGLALTLCRNNLFGDVATSSDLPSLWMRSMWNAFTCNAHLVLVLLAIGLWRGLKREKGPLLWWSSAFTAAVWGALAIFIWVAYWNGRAELATTHFNAIIPIVAAVFVCWRLSAGNRDVDSIHSKAFYLNQPLINDIDRHTSSI